MTAPPQGAPSEGGATSTTTAPTTTTTTTTVAWFHCFAGIAGDMALGSLLDAGADLAEVRLLLGRLALPGWELTVEQSLRGGLACTRALVRGDDEVVVRTHAHITGLITDFHEVGGHDAIVDIVGTVAALEVLGVDLVVASAVATGTGMVRAAHGLLPNPSPAAVRLLEGVPTYGREVGVELTTPTGAALLAALASGFGPMPAMVVTGSGFGGGASELDELPNCTQVVLGQRSAQPDVGAGQAAWVLETNLDDVTGEQLGYAVERALVGGAFDAWVSPVTMKKGRPGHVLHVLTDTAHLEALRHVIHSTTGSFGVRAVATERWPAARTFEEVTIDGMVVRMKVGDGRAKPEFDDVTRVAGATGLAVHEAASRAEQAWRAAQPDQQPKADGEAEPCHPTDSPSA
jgi:uncharacterized protein (DUF111 family)